LMPSDNINDEATLKRRKIIIAVVLAAISLYFYLGTFLQV